MAAAVKFDAILPCLAVIEPGPFLAGTIQDHWRVSGRSACKILPM